MTFVPTPFTTPVVTPNAVAGDAFRRIPYISVSEYRFAPTAMNTTDLVPGSSNPADSDASLAEVVLRASAWVDEICFHRGNGTLAASVTTESDWITVKPDGSLSLICNFKPILEVVGVGLGPSPSQASNIDSAVAADISIGNKVIYLPGSWNWSGPYPSFGGYPAYNGRAYVVWQYVNGYPHMSLAANVAQGATSIQVTPAVAASFPSGVYANTSLTIRDGASTETVQVASTPTSNTLELLSGTQFAHTVPASPDALLISALPWQVEQAAISLATCLIKVRGSRAQVMATTPGGTPTRQAMAQAGAVGDFEDAVKMLKSFVTTYVH